MRVSLDDEFLFDGLDSSFSQGTIVLYAWGNEGATYDNIEVTAINGAVGDADTELQVDPFQWAASDLLLLAKAEPGGSPPGLNESPPHWPLTVRNPIIISQRSESASKENQQ